MENKIIYNSKSIVSIKLIDKRESVYNYIPEKKKTWYRSYKPAHFEYFHSYTIEEIEKECIIVDNVAYWKPYVKISFFNDESYKRTFNSFEEAKDFFELIKQKFIPTTNRIIVEDDF